MAVLLVCVLLAAAAAVVRPQVVLKCCPVGEALARDACEPTEEPWSPVVVSNNFSTVLDFEEVVRDWTVNTARPSCSNPQMISNERHQPPSFLLLQNGSLWYDGAFLAPRQFCVDAGHAVVCAEGLDITPVPYDDTPAANVKRVFIRKCCRNSDIYTEDLSGCVSLQDKTEVTLTSFLGSTASFSVLNVSNTFLKTGFPACVDDFIMTGKLSEHGSALQQDGSLSLPTARVVLPPESFCLENILSAQDRRPTVFTCPSHIPPSNHTSTAPHQHDLRFTIYPIGLLISVLFLVATLVAGCLLPTTHHMLHWRCQTCYVACLLVGDLLLAITHLAGHSFSSPLCITFAVLMHVFFLAAFFWLNTMCFNIWWTFRDLRPTSLDKGQDAWRLRTYEIYAWGCPIFIAGLALLFDNLPQDNLPSVLKPKFGVNNCWFYGDTEILTYFFGPIGVLLFLNLVLFGLTAHELTCGLWKTEVVKSTTERATLWRVCLKLVVVMGITWLADIASWALGGPQYLWYVTDILNTLQGVLIFAVVGCQPHILTAVKRLWCFASRGTTTSANGNHQMSSSQEVPSLGDSITNNTSMKTQQGETIC